MILVYDINIWWSHMRISHYGIWCWYMNFGIWYSHMIMSRAGIWCWYMMFNNPRFHYGIWWSHVNIMHMWSSYTTVFTTVCDFTCDLWDFHMWSWYMKFGIWSWHMKLVYELRYMMFIYDFTCEHFGVWYMKIIGCRIWISHMIKLDDHMPHRIWSYTNIFWKM